MIEIQQNMKRYAALIPVLLLLSCAAVACGPRKRAAKTDTVKVETVIEKVVEVERTVEVPCRAVVKPGIEVLRDRGFDILQGKRVGLVTNPSGVDRNLRSTADILFNAEGVSLVALYGPEHGVRGDVYAGGKVTDFLDPSTGLPVYSLYGPTRKPTQDMLKGIDVMVYDIQDVGTRSYTFISTLGLVMRACSEAGVEVVVLDRPNPLGGNKVEGCVVEPGYFSFISQFRIPYVYGLTVGELASLINEEGLNLDQRGDKPHLKCKLTVVPMEGWKRDMLYADTNLPWVLPSPNIPSPASAVGYPAAGICGDISGFLNIGVGYTIPFQVFAAPWLDADLLKERLDSYNLPGTAFRTIWFKPLFGSMKDKLVQGVQFFYPDYESANLTLTQFYVMQAVAELYPDHQPFGEGTSFSSFDKVCGTDYVRKTFTTRYKVADIEEYWQKDASDFKNLSAKYHLYE